MDHIRFNLPPLIGNEIKYINEAISKQRLSGDNYFTKKCHTWFDEFLECKKSLLTTSCTHALEIAAILADIQPGDEVIMPSYTFVSTANAFVLRGAKIVFVDIRPDTMNIDENLIEAAITDKTKAIVPVHYAGVACEMDTIMELSNKYNLIVIEDAAQGMMSDYKGRKLGTIGHLAAFSFHETKNYTSGGEGGLLIINDERYIQRAEIIREKGTNRSQFFRGMIDKYSWVDIGSSYLPNELTAAYLWGQLQYVTEINKNRLRSWALYNESFKELALTGKIVIPTIPSSCIHNAHMYYIKVKDLATRTDLISYLSDSEISSVFHYVPLHTSEAGSLFGKFVGEDVYTTKESEKLIRLPIYYKIKESDVIKVANTIKQYFS